MMSEKAPKQGAFFMKTKLKTPLQPFILLGFFDYHSDYHFDYHLLILGVFSGVFK